MSTLSAFPRLIASPPPCGRHRVLLHPLSFLGFLRRTGSHHLRHARGTQRPSVALGPVAVPTRVYSSRHHSRVSVGVVGRIPGLALAGRFGFINSRPDNMPDLEELCHPPPSAVRSTGKYWVWRAHLVVLTRLELLAQEALSTFLL